VTTQTEHVHEFRVNPSGPCECGKTWERARAEQQLAELEKTVASLRAYLGDEPAPDVAVGAGESDTARADRLQRACITLGKTFDHLMDSMYAARIEVQRGDHKAACEWVLNAMEGIGADEPGAGWDGSETAQDWHDRTRAADEFNDGKPVRIVSRPGTDITIGTLVLACSPGRADVVCAVPMPGGICGKPLTDGPCVLDHDKTEVDGQASLFVPNGEGQ